MKRHRAWTLLMACELWAELTEPGAFGGFARCTEAAERLVEEVG